MEKFKTPTTSLTEYNYLMSYKNIFLKGFVPGAVIGVVICLLFL